MEINAEQMKNVLKVVEKMDKLICHTQSDIDTVGENLEIIIKSLDIKCCEHCNKYDHISNMITVEDGLYFCKNCG